MQYIDKAYEKYLDDESRINRSAITDTRVHCLLYFIEPTGHGCVPCRVCRATCHIVIQTQGAGHAGSQGTRG